MLSLYTDMLKKRWYLIFKGFNGFFHGILLANQFQLFNYSPGFSFPSSILHFYCLFHFFPLIPHCICGLTKVYLFLYIFKPLGTLVTLSKHTNIWFKAAYKVICKISWVDWEFWCLWHNNLMFSWYWQRQTSRGISADSMTLTGLREQNLLKLIFTVGFSLINITCVSLNNHSKCLFWNCFFLLSSFTVNKSFLPGVWWDTEPRWKNCLTSSTVFGGIPLLPWEVHFFLKEFWMQV